jgi:hypothetical protein
MVAPKYDSETLHAAAVVVSPILPEDSHIHGMVEVGAVMAVVVIHDDTDLALNNPSFVAVVVSVVVVAARVGILTGVA